MEDRKRTLCKQPAFLLALTLLCLSHSLSGQDRPRPLRVPDEEKLDYYQKWLREDVVWIITAEEKEVFLGLTNDDERDAFIEQFWFRRDADPATLENEFKTEHYRRIAFTNENFTAGIDGWKTDRGRIYIKFGPPDRKETYPGGGRYVRERHEGGGITTIFPMERWEYRHIEGVGEDVVLEFVDDEGGGLYELTLDNQRKDALLYSPTMGITQDEEEEYLFTGKIDKSERIARRRHAGELPGKYSASGSFERARDKPFALLELEARLNQPPVLKFKDLEEAVTARLFFGQMNFQVETDFVAYGDDSVLALITLTVPHQELTFRSGEPHRAQVQVFGQVTALDHRIVARFEEDLAREYSAGELESGLHRSSVYQKRLVLKPGPYKLQVGVKDVGSERIGTRDLSLRAPRYGEDLQLSSLVLADRIEGVTDGPVSLFQMGDLIVRPRTEGEYSPRERLGLYFQVYGYQVDQQTLEPELAVEYALLGSEGSVPEWRDSSRSLRCQAGYCRLARMINLDGIGPGTGTLHVRVTDRVSGQRTEAQARFKVLP